MRNLKKILALVLALVMSLSLMATAGAAETTAAAADPYATAQTVLTGLKVFRGNPGGDMSWNQPITRVQTAALVYRINTGDVDDTKAALHTSNPFQDVTTSYWGNSYISYGYNAGILKGMGGNNFAPDNQVTGYQTLAMILRAMGYGRNGEFEGTGWEVRTASTAQSLGLLDNVTPSDSTTLGLPASRGLVAEILLRALLENKVMYSALNPYNYTELDEKLADNLGLEKVEGVVTANEWADLNASSPIASGKTKIELASDGSVRMLDRAAASYEDGIKELGKTYGAYIQNGTKVLSMEYSSKNNVKDNADLDVPGSGVKVDTLKGNLDVANAAYFRNFDPMNEKYSDYRIEYNVRLGDDAAAKKFADVTGVTVDKIKAITDIQTDSVAGVKYAYTKVLPAGKVISADDLSVIEAIFTIADNSNQTLNIEGSVYVGTKSSASSDRWFGSVSNDESDSISFKVFKDTYILQRVSKFDKVGNGNWLQVIDNNGDGKAEYVMKVEYVLDKIVDAVKDKDDNSTYYFNNLDIKKYPRVAVGSGYTEAVGSYYVYALIDGKAYIHDAETATATFKAVSYKDETATDLDGKVWAQSYIDNKSGLPGEISNVDDYVAYTLYLDDYGFVRAYYAATNYALVTEIYPTTDRNHSFVVNDKITAEFVLPLASNSANQPLPQEKNLINSEYNKYSGTWNPFVTTNYWTALNPFWNYVGDYDHTLDGSYRNYLQPATKNLGYVNPDTMMMWYQYTNDEGEPVFDHSWTNVAKYTIANDTDINLFSAVTNTNVNVAPSVDYVQLLPREINVTGTAASPLFNVALTTPGVNNVTDSTATLRAGDDTLFYVVSADGVIRQYIGYKNVPQITFDRQTGSFGWGIHAMYAVAQNISNDREKDNYWMADVIVIEVYETNDIGTVALVYSNDTKNSGTVKYLQAIDEKLGQIEIVPNYSWAGQWKGNGFYWLRNIEKTEDGYYKADITAIQNNFNDAGIYLGVVNSCGYTNGDYARGGYITAELIDTCFYDDLNTVPHSTYDSVYAPDHHGDVKNLTLAATGNAWSVTDEGNYNHADTLVLNNSASKHVKPGDRIIWVGKEAGEIGFAIDLDETSAKWLDVKGKTSNTSISYDIAGEQYGYFGYYHHSDLSFIIAPAPVASPYSTLSVSTRSDNHRFVASAITLKTAGGREINPTYNYVDSNGNWIVGYNLHECNAGDILTVTADHANIYGILHINDEYETEAAAKKTEWKIAVPALAENWWIDCTADYYQTIDADGEYYLDANFGDMVELPVGTDADDPTEAKRDAHEVLDAAYEAAKESEAYQDEAKKALIDKAYKDYSDLIDNAGTSKEATEAGNDGKAAIENIVNGNVGEDTYSVTYTVPDETVATVTVNGNTVATGTVKYNKDEVTTLSIEVAPAAGKEDWAIKVTANGTELNDDDGDGTYTVDAADGLKIVVTVTDPEAAEVTLTLSEESPKFWRMTLDADETVAPILGAGPFVAGETYDYSDVVTNLPVQPDRAENGWDLEFDNGVTYDAETGKVTFPATLTAGTAVEIRIICLDYRWVAVDEGNTEETETVPGGNHGTQLPDGYARMSGRTLSAKADWPEIGEEVDYYIWGIEAGKTVTSVTVNGGNPIVPKKAGTNPDGLTAWTFKLTITGGSYVIRITTTTAGIGPQITTKLKTATADVTTGATITQKGEATHGIYGGKELWNFVYTLELDKYEYTLSADGDSSDVTLKKADGTAYTKGTDYTSVSVSDIDAETKTQTITVKGIDAAKVETATLEVILTATGSSAVAVTVDDPIVYTLDKTKILKGSNGDNETVTISVNEDWAEEYGLPLAVTVKDGGTAKDLGTYFTYDPDTGVVTFLKARTGAIAIGTTANIIGADSFQEIKAVTDKDDPGNTVSANWAVGPKTVAGGTKYSDLSLTLTTLADGKGLPVKTDISIWKQNAFGENEEIEGWDYRDGVITFSGVSGTVDTNLLVVVPSTAPAVIKGLDITFEDNAPVVKYNGTNYTATALKYAVLDSEDDKTLYDSLEETVKGWVGSNSFATSSVVVWDLYGFESSVTLSAEDEGRYLVVVDVAAGSKIVAAGYTEITGITAAAPSGGASMADASGSHLKADLKGQKITLTADEGYVVPKDKSGITSITMDGAEITAATYTYVTNANRTSATITLTNRITDDLVITATGVAVAAVLKDVSMKGDNTLQYGGTPTAGTADDKYVFANASLDKKAIEEKIATIGSDLEALDFIKALGFTSAAAKDLVAGNTDVKAGPGDDGSNEYIIFMHLEGSGTKTVVSAGVCENTCKTI